MNSGLMHMTTHRKELVIIKVIFLDIDGVLNTYYTEERTKTGAFFIEDKKVEILRQMIEQSGAKIVLSSTWRMGWEDIERGYEHTWLAKDFIELRDKLQELGVELYDKTPVLDKFMRRRGEEIELYLKDRDDIEGYAILDDLGGRRLRPCSSHLVQTSEYKGLEEKHIKTVLKMLNKGV